MTDKEKIFSRFLVLSNYEASRQRKLNVHINILPIIYLASSVVIVYALKHLETLFRLGVQLKPSTMVVFVYRFGNRVTFSDFYCPSVYQIVFL